eukprot:1148648-Pelagomonas_calceolata.AAC.4
MYACMPALSWVAPHALPQHVFPQTMGQQRAFPHTVWPQHALTAACIFSPGGAAACVSGRDQCTLAPRACRPAACLPLAATGSHSAGPCLAG